MGALKRGLLLMQLSRVLLGVLNAARALLRQVLVARRLLLREHQRRLRLIDLRLAGGDLRLLDGDLRVDVLDAGLRGRHLRLRLGKRDAVVALVDAGDHVAGGDVLVVGDRHGGDVARHLRRDGKLPRRDEGVVGRLEMPDVVPVEITARRCHDKEKQSDQRRKRVPPQQPLAGLIAAFVILVRTRIFAFAIFARRQFHDAALAAGTLLRRRRPGADGILPGVCERQLGIAHHPLRRGSR